jgi:hypothetical protein
MTPKTAPSRKSANLSIFEQSEHWSKIARSSSVSPPRYMKGLTGIQPKSDPHILEIIDLDEQPSPSPKRSKKEKKFLESSKLDIVPDTPTRKSAKAQGKQKALPPNAAAEARNSGDFSAFKGIGRYGQQAKRSAFHFTTTSIVLTVML